MHCRVCYSRLQHNIFCPFCLVMSALQTKPRQCGVCHQLMLGLGGQENTLCLPCLAWAWAVQTEENGDGEL